MPPHSLLLERLIAGLAVHGRLSTPRRMALECIASEPQRAWSADELRAACNARQAGVISRATAYRVLELLCELGLLVVTTSTDGLQRCVPAVSSLNEIELCDAEQGKLLRLSADRWLRRYVESLALRHGLTLDEFKLELRGRFKPAARRRTKPER